MPLRTPVGRHAAPRRRAAFAVATVIGLVLLATFVPGGLLDRVSPSSLTSSVHGASAAPTDPARALDVVGLGDSVAAGSYCECQPFVQLAADQLARTQQRAAVVTNAAYEGATTSGMLDSLRDPRVRSAMRTSDLVIVEIGANDLLDPAVVGECTPPDGLDCFREGLASVEAKLTQLVEQTQRLQQVKDARIVLLGYWNVFVDGSGAASTFGEEYVAGSAAVTAAFNEMVQGVATRTGTLYADAATPFGKGASTPVDIDTLLTPDGDHPNAEGHQLLASAVVQAVSR